MFDIFDDMEDLHEAFELRGDFKEMGKTSLFRCRRTHDNDRGGEEYDAYRIDYTLMPGYRGSVKDWTENLLSAAW